MSMAMGGGSSAAGSGGKAAKRISTEKRIQPQRTQPSRIATALLININIIMLNDAFRWAFFVGSALLLHAAYGCSQYRELVLEVLESSSSSTTASTGGTTTTTSSATTATTSAQFDGTTSGVPPAMPLDVWIEVAAGFLLLLASELGRTGSALRPIHKQQQRSSSSGKKQPPPIAAPVYKTRYETYVKLSETRRTTTDFRHVFGTVCRAPHRASFSCFDLFPSFIYLCSWYTICRDFDIYSTRAKGL